MLEFDELNIKKSKLQIILGKIESLIDFNVYITAQMKADINIEIDEEALGREQSADKEKVKAKDLRDIKYKLV